jgi:hypothetical protein
LFHKKHFNVSRTTGSHSSADAPSARWRAGPAVGRE